jgi:hypothetical protein
MDLIVDDDFNSFYKITPVQIAKDFYLDLWKFQSCPPFLEMQQKNY